MAAFTRIKPTETCMIPVCSSVTKLTTAIFCAKVIAKNVINPN
jgi:hypothetical protein